VGVANKGSRLFWIFSQQPQKVFDVLFSRLEGALVQFSVVVQVVIRAELVKETDVFGHQPDHSPDFQTIYLIADFIPINAGLSTCHRDQTAAHADRGSFPSPIGPKQTKHLALVNMKCQSVDRRKIPILLR
jgi:hypothetical protein